MEKPAPDNAPNRQRFDTPKIESRGLAAAPDELDEAFEQMVLRNLDESDPVPNPARRAAIVAVVLVCLAFAALLLFGFRAYERNQLAAQQQAPEVQVRTPEAKSSSSASSSAASSASASASASSASASAAAAEASASSSAASAQAEAAEQAAQQEHQHNWVHQTRQVWVSNMVQVVETEGHYETQWQTVREGYWIPGSSYEDPDTGEVITSVDQWVPPETAEVQVWIAPTYTTVDQGDWGTESYYYCPGCGQTQS